MKIISVKEKPAYKDQAIRYIQSKWADAATMKVYENCIAHSTGDGVLPIWYLMLEAGEIIGCAGLITNDFISRMDLYPWICAVYIETNHRGQALGKELLIRAKADANKAGFPSVYLCTDLEEYYEKYGFTYIGDGYHPWGKCSRIYQSKT